MTKIKTAMSSIIYVYVCMRHTVYAGTMQDWNPVVMRKYKPGGAAAKPTPVSMNAVRHM